MRITAELLQRAENYLNAFKEREVNLRGLKIPVIENLAVLQDQYDVIDLSDNDIKKLDGFSMVSRMSVVLASNNSVSRLGSRLGEQLPSLSALVLTNNKISHLSEIEKLQGCSRLEVLSLLDNPVVHKQHYRLFTIFRIPSLKCLDYLKVSKKEREEAKKLFKSPAGAAFLASIKAEGVALQQQQQQGSQAKTAPLALTDSQKAQIKRAIEQASTKDEVDLIELQLKTGTFVFESEESKEGSEQAPTS